MCNGALLLFRLASSCFPHLHLLSRFVSLLNIVLPLVYLCCCLVNLLGTLFESGHVFIVLLIGVVTYLLGFLYFYGSPQARMVIHVVLVIIF